MGVLGRPPVDGKRGLDRLGLGGDGLRRDLRHGRAPPRHGLLVLDHRLLMLERRLLMLERRLLVLERRLLGPHRRLGGRLRRRRRRARPRRRASRDRRHITTSATPTAAPTRMPRLTVIAFLIMTVCPPDRERAS